MKSGASQNFHFNQCLAEKQKVQKGIQFFGHPTSTMLGDKNSLETNIDFSGACKHCIDK